MGREKRGCTWEGEWGGGKRMGRGRDSHREEIKLNKSCEGERKQSEWYEGSQIDPFLQDHYWWWSVQARLLFLEICTESSN